MRPFLQLSQPQVTEGIIERSSARPMHLWPRDALDQQLISTTSRWGDEVWTLDYLTPGSSGGENKIRWAFDLPDGRRLTDPAHADMLDWVRRLVWSLLCAPNTGASALSPGNLGQISTGFRYFLPWLTSNHIVWPEELDQQMIKSYLQDLERDIDDDGEREIDLTQAQIYIKLRPLYFLWQQRFVLERAGINPIPNPPFERSSAHKIARRIAKNTTGTYRPPPDEVTIPILNTSMRMLGTPADDVIALAHGCVEAYANGSSERIKVGAQRAFIRSFHFQKVDGQPWHWPLDPGAWDKSYVQDVKMRLRVIVRGQEVREQREVANADRDFLPSLTKLRVYLDSKRLFINLGLNPSEASALHYHPEWRSAVKDRVEKEHLFLRSGLPAHRVRELVLAIQSAAHLVIQGTAGMRISEIAGMEAGIDQTTGLPTSVEVRDSTSGLGEVFLLRGRLSKAEKAPRFVEWTLGYRLKGSAEIPPAVRAILVVDRLMAPWRSRLGTNDLFITFSNSHALPKSARSLSRPMSYRLRETLRDFIEEWVDLTSLPDNAARPTMENELVPYRESHGRNIKTHQLRKLLANFAFRVDSRLLPVLQMHFHHVSIATTDGAYIMSDPALLRERDDVRHQQAALIALETARGTAPLAGRFGIELEQKIKDNFGSQIGDAGIGTAYDAAFTYVEEAGLDRLFYEPYGICGAKSASEMACHQEGNTEAGARWSHRLEPNYEIRTPSLCAGCPSFVVARWHRPYWEQRYIEHAVPMELAKAEVRGAPEIDPYVSVVGFRMRQALALAQKLGANPVELEKRVAGRVKEIIDVSTSKS